MIQIRKLIKKLRYWWFRHKNKQQLQTLSFDSVLKLLGQLPADDFTISAKLKRSTLFQTNYETFSDFANAITTMNGVVLAKRISNAKVKERFTQNIDNFFLDADSVPVDEARVIKIISTSLFVLRENINEIDGGDLRDYYHRHCTVLLENGFNIAEALLAIYYE